MNKSELTTKLARTARLSLKDAKTAIDCLFDTRPRRGLIAAELDRGRRVTIAGFGTFEMRRRKSRTGRNPRTGQPIAIAASTYPAFKAGVSFKARALASFRRASPPANRLRSFEAERREKPVLAS